MPSLKKSLMEKEELYKKWLAEVEQRDAGDEKDRLEITIIKGKPRYYRTSFDPVTLAQKRTYIPRVKLPEVSKLAQRPYDGKARRVIKRTLKKLESLNSFYEDDEVMAIYNNLSEYRKELVQPLGMTLEQWYAIPYEGLPFRPNDPEIRADNGVRVRSKTEKIMADFFLKIGLLFKYEYPVRLKSGRIVHPDFTFFDPFRQKEIYWEHFGRMDDVDYVVKALHKIEEYEMSGYLRGDQFLVTTEYSTRPLNMNWVKALVKEHLLHLIPKK